MDRAPGVLLAIGLTLLALAIPAIHAVARITAPPAAAAAPDECDPNKRPGSRA